MKSALEFRATDLPDFIDLELADGQMEEGPCRCVRHWPVMISRVTFPTAALALLVSGAWLLICAKDGTYPVIAFDYNPTFTRLYTVSHMPRTCSVAKAVNHYGLLHLLPHHTPVNAMYQRQDQKQSC